MINIPSSEDRRFLQINDSDLKGNMNASFNLGLTANRGVVQGNRSKLVYNTTNDEDFGIPFAIALFDYDNDLTSEYIVLSGTESTDPGEVNGGVFIGGQDPNDTLTQDTLTLTPTTTLVSRADMKVFNNKLWVATANALKSLAKGASTWVSVSTGLQNDEHHMNVLEDRLYYRDGDTTVGSVDSSDVIATTTGTLDLSAFDNVYITFVETGDNKVWIGTINEAGGKGSIFEWDGLTQNTVTRQYSLESNGVLAGVVKNGVLHCMDTEGSLIAFNGNGFTKLSQLPVDEDRPLFNVDSVKSATIDARFRYVHPNGMTLVDGEVNVLVCAKYADGLANLDTGFISGVWSYTQENGLHLKNTPSYSPVGGTVVTDYGQQNLDVAGALISARAGGSASDRNGTYMFGARYYTDATTKNRGLFIDDSIDTTQKWAYFETTNILASGVADKWSKIYAVYKKFLDSSDKIVIKYKTQDDIPTDATITWTDTDTFTSTTVLSAYSEGDEVQVRQGTGSGKSAHISSISESGGTYTVNLDDTFTGATGTAKAFVSKWIKAETITGDNAEKQWNALTINKQNVSPWIQFKVCMQFTGKDELYKLRVINDSDVKE